MSTPGGGGEFNTPPDLLNAQATAESALDAALESVPVEQTTESVPQEAAGTTPEAPSADPQATAGTTPTPTTQGSPQYTESALKLAAKYGGKPEDPTSMAEAFSKAADSYWQTVNQNAEVRELRERLAKLEEVKPGPTPEPKPTALSSPELQQFDSGLASLDAEYKSLDTSFANVEAKLAELAEKREELVAQITSGDLELDVPALQRQLRAVKEQQSRFGAQRTQILAEARANRAEYKSVSYTRNLELRHLQQIQASEAQAREQQTAQAASYKQSWDSTVATVAGTIPEKLRSRFERFVKAEAVLYLQTPGADGHPQVIADQGEFIREKAKEFLDGADEYHRAKSSEYSALKQADATVASPAGKAAAATPTKSTRSIKEWDAHLEGVQL